MSAFVLSDGYFSAPCVGIFLLLVPDLLGMRLGSRWDVY